MSSLFYALAVASSLAGQQDPTGLTIHHAVVSPDTVWPGLNRAPHRAHWNWEELRRSRVLPSQPMDPDLRPFQGLGPDQTPRLFELPPGVRLRVRTTVDKLMGGRLLEANANEVRLQEGPNSSQPLIIPLATVASIDVRTRSTRRGAWILGVSGTVLGGATGAAISGLCDGSCDDQAEAIFVLAAVGGAAGAFLGAIIGAAIPRWERVWP